MSCLEKSAADRPRSYSQLREHLVPYASLAPTPATLGLRFAAAAIDSVLCAILAAPLPLR